MAYELWNGQSGTLLLERSTQEEALDVVRSAIERHGRSYADHLALILEDGKGDARVIAEGADLATLSERKPKHKRIQRPAASNAAIARKSEVARPLSKTGPARSTTGPASSSIASRSIRGHTIDAGAPTTPGDGKKKD
jgi:hypothetical protein